MKYLKDSLKEISAAKKVLRAIDHKVRLKILELIEEKGHSDVTSIYKKLRLEQSVASQHLAWLRNAGLVQTIRDGRCIYYSVNEERINQVISLAIKMTM